MLQPQGGAIAWDLRWAIFTLGLLLDLHLQSYIIYEIVEKWGKNLKQSRSKVPSKMIESWQGLIGVWHSQPQPVWGLSLDSK